MTGIKFCGLSRPCDIESANELKADYIGFVFAENSKRCISPEKAYELKKILDSKIKAVGVFVNDDVHKIADMLNGDIIDMAQLHGEENEAYIARLRRLTEKPIIKAFCIKSAFDASAVERCSADFVLLDSGAGTGTVFDWEMIKNIKRPYFLAGGLSLQNVAEAVEKLNPFAVDVSSGIETDGVKNKTKMAAFAAAVRKEYR